MELCCLYVCFGNWDITSKGRVKCLCIDREGVIPSSMAGVPVLHDQISLGVMLF